MEGVGGIGKQEVVDKLKSGEYRVVYDGTANKKQKSHIWNHFGRVYDNYTPLNYVCCKHCKFIYPYSARGGTSGILKHRCPAFPNRITLCAMESQNDSASDNNYSGSTHERSQPMRPGDNAFEPEEADYHSGRLSGRKHPPHDRSGAPMPEKRPYSFSGHHSSAERARTRLENERLEAEIEYWRSLTKKTNEETKKLQLEQLKLQKELGVMEVVESGPEFVYVDGTANPVNPTSKPEDHQQQQHPAQHQQHQQRNFL